MSVASIARRDFLDVRRAKLVWAPAALYTIFMLLFFWGQSNQQSPDFYAILWSLAGLGGALVIPLIALVAAYLSIAGERESGTIKFTLGQPVARGSVIFGKLLARSGVVFGGILISLVVGLLASRVLVPGMEIVADATVLFALVTLLYALAYVSVAVALSAATSSRSRAMGASIGFFFLFNVVWNFLPLQPSQMVSFVLDELGVEYSRDLLELIWSLSPTGAYLNSMQLIVPERFFQGIGAANTGAEPFYVQGWFMLVILAAWTVVPLALGYWRFSRADIA